MRSTNIFPLVFISIVRVYEIGSTLRVARGQDLEDLFGHENVYDCTIVRGTRTLARMATQATQATLPRCSSSARILSDGQHKEWII